jgi:hypothetical protein
MFNKIKIDVNNLKNNSQLELNSKKQSFDVASQRYQKLSKSFGVASGLGVFALLVGCCVAIANHILGLAIVFPLLFGLFVAYGISEYFDDKANTYKNLSNSCQKLLQQKTDDIIKSYQPKKEAVMQSANSQAKTQQKVNQNSNENEMVM